MQRKKTIYTFGIFFLFLLFMLTPRKAFAQTNFDNKYRDYLLTFEKYKSAHGEYILKRSQFLSFKTLKAESEAYEATLVMLEERDNVVISYLEALKARLNETVGVDETYRGELTTIADQEIAWFNSHKEQLPSAGNLGDLFIDSDEADKRFKAITPIFYKIQAVVSSGRVTNFNERLRGLFENIKEKMALIKAEDRPEYQLPDRKVQLIDRWIFESDGKLIRGEEKKQAGFDLVSSLDTKNFRNVATEYNKALDVLGESQVYFKEASEFLSEVVREIMITD